MTRYAIIAMCLTTFIVLLGIVFFYSSRIRYPSLRSRLAALGLDDCKKYVKDITASVGDMSSYCEFMLTCDFALSFRETCGKAAISHETLGVEIRALEDRFVYGVEDIIILRDNGVTDYKFLKKSINRLSGIKREMQRFLSKLPERVQPC